MGTADDLQELGLVVGRIVEVDEHPGARAPSYRLTIDLGAGGRHAATLPAAQYDAADLVDRQVVCAVEGNEALLVGVHSHAKGLVLLVPERDVEDGSSVA